MTPEQEPTTTWTRRVAPCVDYFDFMARWDEGEFRDELPTDPLDPRWADGRCQGDRELEVAPGRARMRGSVLITGEIHSYVGRHRFTFKRGMPRYECFRCGARWKLKRRDRTPKRCPACKLADIFCISKT
jgi:hypothetical protein